jgi:hypothetical protein
LLSGYASKPKNSGSDAMPLFTKNYGKNKKK